MMSFRFRRQDSVDMMPRTTSHLSIYRVAVGILIAISIFAASAVEATSSYFKAEKQEWPAVKESSPGTTNLAFIPASPDCWLDAIQSLKIHTGSVLEEAFHATSTEGESHPLTSVTCSWLTAVDQKVLALELSKCHMRDLQRPLFHFETEEDRKACETSLSDYSRAQEEASDGNHLPSDQTLTSRNIATKCLARLTDSGVNSYTHFFSYVNQLCTRLLSEFVLGQYYETSYHLARSSKVAEAKIQSLIEQQDLLFHRWTEREQHVLGMYDQLESHVEMQTVGLESKIERLRTKLGEEHEHWKEEYARFQENLVKEMERHQREFAFFSGIVRKVQDSVATCTLAVESLWKSVQIGQSVFRGIFLSIGGIFSSLILTWPGSLRSMRSTMIILLLTELMVEGAVLVTILQGGDKSSLWRDAYLNQCEAVRTYVYHCLCVYFAFGLVRAAIFGCKNVPNEEEVNGREEKNERFAHSMDVEALERRSSNRQHRQGSTNQSTPLLHHQSAASPPFRLPLLHHGATRTGSKDYSAAATGTSQATADRQSVAAPPNMIRHQTVNVQPSVVYTAYPMGNSVPPMFVGYPPGPAFRRSPTTDSRSDVGGRRQAPPGMTNHMTSLQQTSTEESLNSVDGTSEPGDAAITKRTHSALSAEQDRPMKRSRREEENSDEEEESDMEVEAEETDLMESDHDPEAVVADDTDGSGDQMEA